MTTTPAPSPESVLFSGLLQSLANDIFASGSGLLTAFFTNVQKNPTTQNVIAQGAILAASAPMQLPNLEQAALSQVATTGLALVALIKPPTV